VAFVLEEIKLYCKYEIRQDMRFLLFPKTTKKYVSNATINAASRERLINKTVLTQQRHEKAIPKSTVPTSKISAEKSLLDSTKVIWGQQCSENCGCVVRFTASVDTITDSVVSIDYTCKTLIIGKHPTSNELVVAKTSKGRPLLKECKCTTLQSLSNSIVHEIRRKPNWKQLYSDTCNFETNRSSTAFRQAVLNAHKLPSKDTSCFDVVEEALTAMIKGYMPSTRHANIVVATQQRVQKQLQQFSNIEDRDDDEQGSDTYYDMDSDYYQNMRKLQSQSFFGSTATLPFGNIVQQLSSKSILSLSSTLSMYDHNLARQQQQEEEEKQQRKRQLSVQSNSNNGDWESYVDYQHQEDEKTSA
jgi:hypothetical protein